MPSATTATPSAAPSRTMASTSAASTPPSEHRAHEREVDLELVDRQGSKVPERREAGPEVVERHPTAGGAQRAEVLDALLAAVEDDALGDLEVERVGRHAGLAERPEHVLDEVALAQLARGHVDAEPEVRGGATAAPQLGQLATGPAQHPAAQRRR